MKSIVTAIALFIFTTSYAQENYEIQVYSSPTQAPKSSIFELHSNFTFNGEKAVIDNVRPSYHSLHETVEITTGIADNFELGVYLFANVTPSYGFQIIGTHIRPRVTAPLSWHLPVGLSLSTEIGYQKSTYSEDTWNIEIRPIIDKQWEKLYLSFNPTFGIALKGFSNKHTPVFEPNVKIAYPFSPKANFGIEYYGGTGYINEKTALNEQGHALFLVYDLVGNANWELNIGGGWGLTKATDKFVGKILVGRRINWGKKEKS